MIFHPEHPCYEIDWWPQSEKAQLTLRQPDGSAEVLFVVEGATSDVMVRLQRVQAALNDHAALTASLSEWQRRAEAAEKQVAAVREARPTLLRIAADMLREAIELDGACMERRADRIRPLVLVSAERIRVRAMALKDAADAIVGGAGEGVQP